MTTTRVLVVDSHPIVRWGLERLLATSDGMRVVGGCGEGEEVLRIVEKLRPDLVIIGLNVVGEKDGIAICQLVSSLSEAPYVLIYTANDFAQDLSSCLLAGADSYLNKRTGQEDLLDAVQRTAAGERIWRVVEDIGEPRSHPNIVPCSTQLTIRETEVLTLKLRRRTNAEIAKTLYISCHTVKHHVTSIYKKLGITRKDLL